MSAHERPQDGTRLVDGADVDLGATREHAATSGASRAENGVAPDAGPTAIDHDVHVRVRRRLARLANLHRQVAQVVESLAEDAETLLDVRRVLSPVRGVDEHETTAPETASDLPAKARSTALLGVPELAAFLGVEVSTVRRWRRAGKLPGAVEIGNVVRWCPEDVDAWIEANREAPR